MATVSTCFLLYIQELYPLYFFPCAMLAVGNQPMLIDGQIWVVTPRGTSGRDTTERQAAHV